MLGAHLHHLPVWEHMESTKKENVTEGGRGGKKCKVVCVESLQIY